MRTTVTVVAWSLCVCVCLLVTIASGTKTAETTDMPCGLWTPGDPNNRVLDDCPDSPTVGALLWRRGVVVSGVRQ